MARKQCLVRDEIPDIIRANGEVPLVRVLSPDAYRHALRHKVGEEAFELIEAATRDEILEELADLQELISTILAVEGINQEELLTVLRLKRKKRGGFWRRYFLEDVEHAG